MQEFAEFNKSDDSIRPRVESFRVEFKTAALEDFDDLDGLLNDLGNHKKRMSKGPPALPAAFTLPAVSATMPFVSLQDISKVRRVLDI